MFDINAIVNAAIATAVQEAIKPLVERIAVLEKQLNEDFANLVEKEVLANFACSDVIGYDEFNKVKERIVALEDNPAHSVGTTLADRAVEVDNDLVRHNARIAALEVSVKTLEDRVDANDLTKDDVEAIVERALDDHCSTYNHDDYDDAVSKVEDFDPEDVLTADNLNDAINEALNGATVSIQV